MSWKIIMLILLFKNIFVLPKQFPLNGMNILQAVAIGVSTDMRVLIIASSTLIIIAENTKHYQLYILGLYVPTTHKVESISLWSWHWARDLASNTNRPLWNAEQHCSKALISIPTRNTGITYTPSAKRKDSTAEPITILATSNYSSYDKTQKI